MYYFYRSDVSEEYVLTFSNGHTQRQIGVTNTNGEFNKGKFRVIQLIND